MKIEKNADDSYTINADRDEARFLSHSISQKIGDECEGYCYLKEACMARRLRGKEYLCNEGVKLVTEIDKLCR